MLLNRLLIILKFKVVDIPLINKYINEGRSRKDAQRMYNDAVNHGSFGRQKLNEKDFLEIWNYLK